MRCARSLAMKSLSTTFVFASLLGLAACSSNNDPATTPGVDASTADAVADTGPGCHCVTTDAGDLTTMDLACVCPAAGCSGYAVTVANLCSKEYYRELTETTYAACSLKKISYGFGASSQTEVYDGTTGALIGVRSDDDVPGRCPGSGTPISSSTAAGTFDPPASCGQATSRPLCPAGDGGVDGSTDGSADGEADGSSADAHAD